ncbi:hypothetical protein CAEBREN_01309 [Caenorhabditis brenneri]|uniref:F-box domain-containing protein n=1 Tax=Caenorhabditis brenneri TaxID=135651 RepID=G0N1I4_CAEBE|nr:hypothetical protein CAEBREN_01309 [Caenorhabditis brenneri]
MAAPVDIMSEKSEKCEFVSIMPDSPPTSLLTMPEDVMRKIMEEIEYVDIQRLRKTCFTLRNIIDTIKPKPGLDHIDISGSADNLSVSFYGFQKWALYPRGPKVWIEYRKTNITWHRSDEDREKTMDNENFLDVFSRDFGSFLSFKPIIGRFSITSEQNGLKTIRKSLESSGKTPLKVRFLSISNATCQEDVLDILPFICPKSLEILRINCFRDDPTDTNFVEELTRGKFEIWDISKIMELEHWKKVENWDMRRIKVQVGSQNIEHFRDAKFCMKQLTVEDMIRVKENFLHSTYSKYLLLFFQRLPDKDVLNERFGQPHRLQNHTYYSPFPTQSWFFRRPDNFVICIDLTENCFVFDLKHIEYVPEEVRMNFL